MPAEVINKWCKAQRYADINGFLLCPQAHPRILDTPLSIQRGQAETFFLKSKEGHGFVLKKFFQGKFTGTNHLNKVSAVLPPNAAFESGTKRHVLTPASLNRKKGYYARELANWLNNCILMPKIPGVDWAATIDRIRDGRLKPSSTNRLLLAKHLTSLIVLLENRNIAHRDLSGGNVFVHNQGIKLIDFDSIYHPSLAMPQATTLGSEGYIAPFASDAKATWNPMADRFALTILNIEFLILDANSPMNGEGGIFDQDDLYKRSGKTIDHARNILRKKYPEVLNIFNTALSSSSFRNCPSPSHWNKFCTEPSVTKRIEKENVTLEPPAYTLLQKPMPYSPHFKIASWMKDTIDKYCPPFAEQEFNLPKPKPVLNVTLPPNPWETQL